MKIHLLKHKELPNIPSGSGLVLAGNIFYAVGDDSPYLFAWNRDFKLVRKTKLIEAVVNLEGRIEKTLKPDFEAMEIIEDKDLLVFGSGSLSPQRDLLLHIDLQEPMQIKKHLLTEFYDSLRSLPIMLDSELNLEAVAYHSNRLFLLNRSNNLILAFDYKQFSSYLQKKSELPKPEIKRYFLPSIQGIEAGFSGATTLKGEARLVFTASVENTNNAYDDGKILGSFIGMIDISNDKLGDIYDYCQIPNIQSPLKIESVSITEEINFGETKVAMLTDNDLGSSILIQAVLLWETTNR